MRAVVRSAVLVLVTAPLAACSLVMPVVGGGGGNTKPAGGSAVSKTGPLGVLPVPSGARAWTQDGATLMKTKAFVQGFYVKSAWTDEEGAFSRRQFVSGMTRGWTNSDDSQQEIAIMSFKQATDAKSQFDSLTQTLIEDMPKGGKKVTDSADGGLGTINPKLDSLGNARVELVARLGSEVIDVHEFTPASPDPAAAKALLLKQVKALKSGQ